MRRENQCWNASWSNGNTAIVTPQCFDNDITHLVIVTYSEDPCDQDVLYLCEPCALAVNRDAKRHGYRIAIQKLDTEEKWG